MKHKPDTAYIAAWRKRIAAENVRAAYLMAKHKLITERIAAIEAAKEAA